MKFLMQEHADVDIIKITITHSVFYNYIKFLLCNIHILITTNAYVRAVPFRQILNVIFS